MSRPPGSKNKKKAEVIPEHAKTKGNPEFNLKAAEPVEWGDDIVPEETPAPARAPKVRVAPEVRAVGAITQEDLDLEMHLNKLDRENPVPNIDPDLSRPMTKEKISQDHLREHVDNYKAASNINELEEQIHVAKSLGCDSIDADKNLIHRFSRGKDNGMFIMVKDIRVNYPGQYASGKAQDKVTIEGRLFGAPV